MNDAGQGLDDYDSIPRSLAQHDDRIWREGWEAGIREFAWWADGVQYVGTCGTTLESALTKGPE